MFYHCICSFLQKIGVTAFLPEKVPSYLPYKGTASSMEWLYGGRQLFHNKEETHFPSLPSLRPLSPGQTVGLLLTATGGLHIYLEGRPVMKVASGLPVNESLWGVVDVCGICSKIKSEMLNCELDVVFMYTLIHIPGV